MPNAVEKFKQLYHSLSRENLSLELLHSAYRADVEFRDPLHSLHGTEQMLEYFRELYSNVEECEFNFEKEFIQGEEAVLFWTMQYRHHRLNKGRVISVQGNSLLRFNAAGVYYHRDYIDMGAMLYEHIPLLGGLIRYLKRRLQ